MPGGVQVPILLEVFEDLPGLVLVPEVRESGDVGQHRDGGLTPQLLDGVAVALLVYGSAPYARHRVQGAAAEDAHEFLPFAGPPCDRR